MHYLVNNGTLYEFSLNASNEWSVVLDLHLHLDRGNFSFMDANANPGTISLALRILK